MRPAPVLLMVLCGWLALACFAVVYPTVFDLWRGSGIAIAVIALIDYLSMGRESSVSAERRLPQTLPLGVWGEISIRLRGQGQGDRWADIFDHYPTQHVMTNLPQRERIRSDGWTEITYHLLPTERGEFIFPRIELLIDSPLRFWKRRVRLPVVSSTRVYPNFAAVSKYALLATDNHLSQLGVRKRRRRGEGLEFHQLREYRPGDSLRQVDWRATSRHGKLISKEYQDQRDQQVFFLIDCGRRMTAKDDELSHFDHSLNSVLLLAYVALRQGDSVGLMTFSGEPRFMPPRKGAGALTTVLNTLYDLQPALHSPDYATAASALRKRLKKRSLVVMVTNLRDEDSEELLPVLSVLSRRHLVMVASLREPIISSTANKDVTSFDEALDVAASMRYLLARKRIHDSINKTGALSLDVEPQLLPINLVNRYLDVKVSGRL